MYNANFSSEAVHVNYSEASSSKPETERRSDKELLCLTNSNSSTGTSSDGNQNNSPSPSTSDDIAGPSPGRKGSKRYVLHYKYSFNSMHYCSIQAGFFTGVQKL